jgi:hypothetical protein
MRKIVMRLGEILCSIAVILPRSVPAQVPVHDVVELKRDVSPPLSELLATAPTAVEPLPVRHRRRQVSPPLAAIAQPDSVFQTLVGPLVGTTPGLNFDGLGRNFIGPAGMPPDPNGAIGAYQYVEWVNYSFAVFAKSNGAVISGPTAGNALWSGLGAPCETHNDGDPIVLYDKAANRWVFTQLVGTTPSVQCIAISNSENAAAPTTTFYRYAISMPNFCDYRR